MLYFYKRVVKWLKVLKIKDFIELTKKILQIAIPILKIFQKSNIL